ncbi:MAG: aminomethyl-transferring glycine dehydrogenase subunit GcvPB [Bacillota bacterium]
MAYDQLIFERSQKGRIGYSLPKSDIKEYAIDESLKRKEAPNLPEVSEFDVVRHFTNVSFKNHGIETGFYPLGSCTMKYNPKIDQDLSNMESFTGLHPYQPVDTVQGVLEILYETQKMLSRISGLDTYSLNPYAGAHGELVGLMIMRHYHASRKDFKRKKIIVPDSAHGTNPASAATAGFDVVEVSSNQDGTVNLNSLRSVLDDSIAGIMLTNPNTIGMFEKDIMDIATLVHEAGGLLYYDGANLNPMMGMARPGDMGFDIMHINLHKTFSTPHGGGGPGSGPVGVTRALKPYLPEPVVRKAGNHFFIDQKDDLSIGRISHFYGNVGVVLKAYAFLRTNGKEHLYEIAKYSTLNANYIKESLKDTFKLPIKKHCKHEFVFDGLIDKSTGVTTYDISKRLLDFGIHPPTMYFPLLYKESMMIEPVENESKQTMDHFIKIMKEIAKEAITDPDTVKTAPHTTPVKRLDEAKAARNPKVKFKDLTE